MDYLLKNTVGYAKPCYCEIQTVREVAATRGEKAVQRAELFIQKKGQSFSEEQKIPVMWHEIAQIMGYEEIEQLFLEQQQYSEEKKLTARYGFFGDTYDIAENRSVALESTTAASTGFVS